MPAERERGVTQLDRLKSRYDSDLRCRECGFEDTGGDWQARTTGERVSYRHVCPSCGAIKTRTLGLKR
jgi:predicted RNA-binding Zn-ribbon protein involved in translation (DUF1610 family)